jgi:hypothetical protein
MQHEALHLGPTGQAFSARTDNISQDMRATAAPSVRDSEPQGEDATLLQEIASPPEAPGETHEADPAARPPIAPPRSWTKDARAHWQTLPRETQAYVAAREQERERELRRSQNEAAAKLKSLKSKEQAAEQARQKYEIALPTLLQALQGLQAATFADITSVEDANRLAVVDPPRFKLWQAHRQQIGMLEQELRRARQHRVQDSQARWSAFASEQDRLFLLRAPKLSNPTCAQRAMDAATRILEDIGFNQDELKQAWTGERFFSLRDHRLQWLIFENIRYREQCDIVAVTRGNAIDLLPSLRRLATASARSALASSSDAAAFIQTLEQKLETTSGLAALRLGAMLTALKQHSAAR